AWLHRTALRLAVRARQARQARRPRPAEVPCRPAAGRSPLDELSARELLAALDGEGGRPPEEQRPAGRPCALEGVSREEAAARLGWTAGSVKGRLERGRQRLRERLEERGLGLPAALAGPLVVGGPVPAALVEATRGVIRGAPLSVTVRALAEEGAGRLS